MNRDPAVLDAITEIVPALVEEILPRTWMQANAPKGAGRCLPASRLGLETLRYFGFDAKAVVTRAIAGNAAWIPWWESGAEPPMPDEAWAVGTGTGAPDLSPRGLDGHVVLIVEKTALLDLDAGPFFARPDPGIHVPPVVEAALQHTNGTWGSTVWLDEGGVLVYVKHPKPPTFHSAGDWKHTGKDVGEAIRRVKAVLRL